MTPFAISGVTPYLSAAPPAISSDAYTAAYNDVKTFGMQDGDALRNEIAQFWLAEGGTVRETGNAMQALVAIVAQRGTDGNLSETARLFALVGMAVADSVKAVWHTKAQYFTWRPFTAIREGDSDGNPNTAGDTSWTPRNTSIGASPEYNSGTSAFGGAFSAVVERFYCRTDVGFCFETDGSTSGERCYTSALQMAEEAGRSRIYQGIHFQFSNEDGRRVGRLIGHDIAATHLQRLGGASKSDKCSLP